MKSIQLWLVGITLIVFVLGAPLLAHHGTNISYDHDKPTTLKGVVTEFVWSNPHCQLYFDVKDGLLLRRRHEVTTPLGVLPSEYDYDDYRAVDALKVPFKMTWSRADYHVTHVFDDVKAK